MTHNVTGLKYFGKTIKDLNDYYGSGTAWNLHCVENGYNMTKEVILKVENTKENQKIIRETAQKFSIDHDIVDNDKFANLINESGTAGFTNFDVENLNESIREKANRKQFKISFDVNKTSLKMVGKDEILNIKSQLTRGPGTKVLDNGTVVIRYDNPKRIEEVYDRLQWSLYRNSKALKDGAKVILIPINKLKEVGLEFTLDGDVYPTPINEKWADL